MRRSDVESDVPKSVRTKKKQRRGGESYITKGRKADRMSGKAEARLVLREEPSRLARKDSYQTPRQVLTATGIPDSKRSRGGRTGPRKEATSPRTRSFAEQGGGGNVRDLLALGMGVLKENPKDSSNGENGVGKGRFPP